MYKWSQHDRTVIILCNSCSKKEYKKLDIRQAWWTKELGKEFKCEKCGVTEEVSKGPSE